MKFNRLLIIALSLVILGSITITCSNLKAKLDYPFNTSWAPAGDNTVLGLATNLLKVTCAAGSVLSGFHLQRNGGQDKIRYQFNCLKHAGVGTKTYSKDTDWTERGTSKGTNYLDRQNVRCEVGYGIQSFWLENNGKLRYRYKCVEVSS